MQLLPFFCCESAFTKSCVGAFALGMTMLVGCSTTGSKSKSLVAGLPSPRATVDSAEKSAPKAKSTGLLGKKMGKADPNAKAIQELLTQGRAYEARSKEDQAAKCYEDVLEMDRNNLTALHRLGVIADSQGAVEEAEMLLTQAIKQAPKNAEICSDLGYCYFLQERYSDAESLMRQALAQDKNNALYHNNLGLVLGHQQKYDEAFDAFSKAGTKADAYYNMAFVFAMQDHVEEAQECFREVLTIKPDHKGAKEALANFQASENGGTAKGRGLAKKDQDNRNWVPYVEPGTTEQESKVATASGSQSSAASGVKQASAEASLPKTSDVSRFTRALHKRSAGVMNHHMASQRGDSKANPSSSAPKGNLMPVSAN